jgi:hypothetical protein
VAWPAFWMEYRPNKPAGRGRSSRPSRHWKKKLVDTLRENELLKQKLILKDLVSDIGVRPGMGRVKKNERIIQAVTLIEKMKADFALTFRQIITDTGFSYASFMRWRKRIAAGEPPARQPGSKKVAPFDLGDLSRMISSLDHGSTRSWGAGSLHAFYKGAISCRELNAMVASVRREENRKRTAGWCRVIWHRPDLVWALDGFEYVLSSTVASMHVQNLQDLCSRYKFPPLATRTLPYGEEVTGYLDRHFTRYGPLLFVKRDNGGNLNHVSVNQLLEEPMVVPINSPVNDAHYNGAVEHSQGEIKGFLKTWRDKAGKLKELFLLVETAVNDLNHKPRRSLGGRTACRCYFGINRIRNSKRKRKAVYRWIRDLAIKLSGAVGRALISPAAWRVAARKWLVENKLINIIKPKKVLPYFLPILSHN